MTLVGKRNEFSDVSLRFPIRITKLVLVSLFLTPWPVLFIPLIQWRTRTGVRRELAARVDVNVLRWFGHVERMDNERLLKKVMNAKVDRRSARGRPRFGWMDGVKRALNDRRMDIREASERARNRNEWRMIVTQF